MAKREFLTIDKALHTLGLNRGATPEKLKKTYRKLAMKTHPDKGGNAEEFIAVNKAYNYLVKCGTGSKTGKQKAVSREDLFEYLRNNFSPDITNKHEQFIRDLRKAVVNTTPKQLILLLKFVCNNRQHVHRHSSFLLN